MLRIEEYKKEIKNFDSERKNMGCYLSHLLNTNNHDNNHDYCYNIGCSTCLKNSLLELMKEYKEPIKLTPFEFEILKYAKSLECNFMARDKNKSLYSYNSKPLKREVTWGNEGNKWTKLFFNDLFNFVKWEDEEPWEIEEILSNCEVVEDE